MPTAAAASAGPQHPPTNITALPWRTLSQLAAAEGSIRHHERVRKARAAAREREEGLELVYSCGNATNTAAATRGGKRGASSASKNSRQHSAGPLSSTAAAAAKYNNNTSTKNNSFQQQRPLLADTTQAATLGGLVKERRRRSDSAPSRPITAAATADNSKLSLTERLANPPPQPHSRLAYMRGRNEAAAAAREATVEQRRLRSRHQHALVTRGALAAARSGSARNAEERKAATGARRQRFLLQEDDVYGDDTHRNYGVGDDGDDDVFAPYDINGAYAPSSPSAATADGQRMYRSMRGERPSYSPHRSTSRGVTRGRPVANARDGSPMRGRGQGDTSSSAALYFPDEEAFEAYFVEHWRGDEASGGRVGGPHSLLNESGGGLSAFGITRRRRGQRPSAAGSSRSGSVSRSTSVSMGDSRSNSLSMANSSQQSRANNNDNISGHGAQNKSRGEAMGEGEGGANGVSGEHNNSSSSPLAAKGLTPLALPLRPNAAASRLSLQPARRHHQDDTNHLHLVSSDEGGGGDLTARAEDDGVPPSDYAVAAPAALRTEPMPLTSRPSSRPPTEQTQRQKSGAKSAVNSKGSYDTAADLAEYAAIRVDGGDEGAPTCNAHNRREEGSDDDSAFFGHRSHPHQQHLLHSGREREEDTSNNHSADTNAANANNASAVAPSGASLRRPSSVRASVSAFFADGDSGNSTNAEESSSDDDDAPPVVRDERLRQMAERLNISYTEIAPTNPAFEEATSSSDEGDAAKPRSQVKGVPAKKQKGSGKEESRKKKGQAQAGEEKHHPLSTIDASLLTPLFDPSAPSVCVALASFRHHWRRAIGAAETKGRTALIAAEGKAFSSLVYYFSTGHDAVAAREASVGKWAVVIATAEAAHRRKVIEDYFASLDTLAFSEASARRKLSKFLARRLAKRGDTSEDAVALRRAAAMVGLEEALRSAVTADESPATSTTVAIRGKSSTTAAAVNPQRIGTAGLSTAATRRDKLASSSSALPHPSAPAGRLGGAAPPPAISSNASDRPPTAGSTCPAAASSSSVVDGKRRVGSAAGRFGGSATTKGAASRPQTSDSAAIGANGLPTVTPSSSAAAAVPHSANPNSANSVTARELRQRDERWLHEARRFTDGLRRELYANAWRSGGGAGGTNTEDPAPNRTRTGDTETDGEGAGKKKRVTKKKQLSHSPDAEKTAKAKEKERRRREKRRGEEAEAKSGAPPALSAAVRARAAKVFDDRQQTAAAAERRADRIHRRLSRLESEGDFGEAYDAMFWGGGGGGPAEEGPPSRVGGRALTKYYYRGLAIAPAPAARLREKGSIADGPTATDRKKGLPLEATEDVPNTRFFLLPMGASTDAKASNKGSRQGLPSTVHRESAATGVFKGEGANDEAPIISFVQRTEDPSEHLLTAGGGSAHLREPSEASSGSALLLASEQNPNPSSSGGAHGGGGVRLSLTPPPGSQQQHAAHLLLHNAGGGVPSSTGGGLSANNGATTTRSSRSSHRSRSPDGGATPSDGGGVRTPNASYMYLRTHSNGGASSTATTAMTGSVCAYGQRSGFVGIGGGGGGLSASHHSFGLGNSHNHNQSPETARRRRRMRHYLPADADDDAATGGNAAADDGTHSGRSSPSLAAADNIDAPAPATRQGGGGVRFAPQRSGVFGERIRRAQAMLQQQQQQNSKGTATASDRAAVGSPTPQQPLSSLGGSPSSSPMKGTKEQRGDADGVTKNREAKKGGGGGGSPTSALRPPSNSAAWLAAEEGQPSGNQHDEEGSHFSVGGDTLQQHKKRGEVSERRRGPPVAVLLVDDGDNGEGESERLSRRSARPTSSAAGGSAADAAACRTASMASAVSAASSSQRTAVSGLSDHGGRRALGYLPQPSEADAEKGTEGEGARLFHPTSFYRTVNGGVGATPAGGEDGDATNNARRRPTAIARAIAAAAAAQTKYYSVEEEGGEETHTLHAPRNGAYDDSDGDAENRRTDIDVSGAHQAPMSDGSASSSTTHPDPFEAAAAAMQRHTTMQLRIAGRHVRAASESSDSDQQSWELGADDF